MPASSWVFCTKSHARLRLFCFPYAGGGASIYHPWSKRLSGDVEICPLYLPGRENRLREPCFKRLSSLVEELTDALTHFMDVPFAFFGHSMGALISFEVIAGNQILHNAGRVLDQKVAQRLWRTSNRNERVCILLARRQFVGGIAIVRAEHVVAVDDVVVLPRRPSSFLPSRVRIGIVPSAAAQYRLRHRTRAARAERP